MRSISRLVDWAFLLDSGRTSVQRDTGDLMRSTPSFPSRSLHGWEEVLQYKLNGSGQYSESPTLAGTLVLCIRWKSTLQYLLRVQRNDVMHAGVSLFRVCYLPAGVLGSSRWNGEQLLQVVW